MVKIANPIYDTVFKYLMEDERIARTLLSALLKKNIEEIEMRRHEYSNNTRESLSMFRVDFVAKVVEPNGEKHLVLIELQKTWLETETLRFRQYLGVHYSNPENIEQDGTKKGMGIPIVAVYLLGHRVGDIEEPVLYVNHGYHDYDGELITRGVPEPFVESLVHDSIIVQIPLLHGKVNNRLEQLLSIFDQTRKDGKNRQLLSFSDETYIDDTEMQRILHRLTAAAADQYMRHNMNVEDEYFSAIENRDTELLLRKKQLVKTQKQLSEAQGQLSEAQGQLSETQGQLSEAQAMIVAKEKEAQRMVKALRERGMSEEEIRALLG